MKTSILFLSITFLVISSCTKKTNRTMTVIKACEGTYLRFNEKDYTICNEEKLDNFENGQTVTATIIKEDACKSDKMHCMVVHDFETVSGNFKITKIK